MAITNIEDFDLVITDLDVVSLPARAAAQRQRQTLLPELNPTSQTGQHIKAFKICASNFRRDEFDEEELKNLVATVWITRSGSSTSSKLVQDLHENIEFELPSSISLMHIVLDYLMKRVEKLGVIKPEQSNLFVALDEAFVNAVKHGNKFDVDKLVRITADVSQQRGPIYDRGRRRRL